MKRRHRIRNLFWFLLLGTAVLVIGGFIVAGNYAAGQRRAAMARLGKSESITHLRELYEAVSVAPEGGDVAQAGVAEGGETQVSAEEVDRVRRQMSAYEALAAKWKALTKDPAWMQIAEFYGEPMDTWTGAQWEAAEAFIAANQDLVASIRKLAAGGGPLYPLDFSERFQKQLPHLGKIREFGRMLRLDAAVQSRAGNMDSVTADIVAQLQLAEALAEEPILVSQLVRGAVEGIAGETLRDTVAPGTLSGAQMREILAALPSATELREEFAVSSEGEASMGLQGFEILRNGELSLFADGNSFPPFAGRLAASPLGRLVIDLDSATYADLMASLIEAARHPYYEAQPAIQRIDEETSQLPFYKPFTRASCPSLSRMPIAEARQEVNIDLMRTGLLLEQYQAEHGAYPPSLDAIAGALGGVPIDPFTGEPYRYMPGTNGFTLYSLGQNQTDEGGEMTRNNREGDLTWRGYRLERLACNAAHWKAPLECGGLPPL